VHWINDERIHTGALCVAVFIVAFAVLLFLRQADLSGVTVAPVADLVFIAGLWAVLSPAIAMRRVAVIHREIDSSDARLWWMPRFTGVGLMALSLLVILATFAEHLT
jgi:hypothetical protein